MVKATKIELLAPAKDITCGKEAILHGADAVYIGAPAHGARAAASNPIEDIKALTDFAHIYNAKVYVTVNTIIYDNELDETRKMICDLYHAGVDALIVQDMGIMEMDLPPIAMHASTQIDTRTAAKAKFLEQSGFSQIVLARELDTDQIAEIAQQVNVPIEVFVHGALCVSYSGQCYVSQKCFARSANRGECAQFCRLPLTLTDAEGNVIMRDKHLLSLKDLNRSNDLESLLDAGARSLKIEGRLKDANYVKNVTAYYRRKLDEIFARRPEYCKSSSGNIRLAFEPDLNKSFNRGFTNYFPDRSKEGIWSFDTPKSLGEYVGKVKTTSKNAIEIDTATPVHNGDGLCFIDNTGALKGFRVNKVDGKTLHPLEMPKIARGCKLFRNNDAHFNKMLSKESAERRIALCITLQDNAFGFTLSAVDEDGNRASTTFECKKEPAKTDQDGNIKRQLSKLGETPFEATTVTVALNDKWFIPSSALSSARRSLTDAMLVARKANYKRESRKETRHAGLPVKAATYRDNIANRLARQFYNSNGCNDVSPAYELSGQKGATLMECKHCIRYALGYCTKDGRRIPYKEPLRIAMQNGKSFRLQFDCKCCKMLVIDDDVD